MGLNLVRQADESWRDAVKRYAQKFGLEDEALRSYDDYVRNGVTEPEAAWDACYDWDVLDLEPEDKG